MNPLLTSWTLYCVSTRLFSTQSTRIRRWFTSSKFHHLPVEALKLNSAYIGWSWRRGY